MFHTFNHIDDNVTSAILIVVLFMICPDVIILVPRISCCFHCKVILIFLTNSNLTTKRFSCHLTRGLRFGPIQPRHRMIFHSSSSITSWSAMVSSTVPVASGYHWTTGSTVLVLQ
jgi:hypothetical protein